MSKSNIETRNLNLVLQSPEDVLAQINAMSDADKAEVSADWMALVNSATSANPWIHGFMLVEREEEELVGSCGFKGPPSADGVVEIAYGIAPEYQGKGYATEAAHALVHYALQHDSVCIVRAHTLPEANASARVLTKCGFEKTGEVVDPDDGVVWRWEKRRGL